MMMRLIGVDDSLPNNKFEYYSSLREKLEGCGFKVEDYKEINYGLQFNLELDARKSLVRIYESKKGIRADLSQVKDKEILDLIEKILFGKIEDTAGSKAIQTSGRPEKYGGKKDTSFRDPDELIGTDESGKGDYFGPLVIAGVFVDVKSAPILREMGVDDSKKLSDKQIGEMAPKIKEMCPHSVVVIGNEKYNELYDRIKNLNKLLAWGHARVIENMLGKVECPFVLSDQFGDPSLIENALMEKGRSIKLSQRPRAEENVAVAAASILARNEFVVRMEQMEQKYGMKFPKGALPIVIEIAKQYVWEFGEDNLKNVAKLNFKTTSDVLK